MGFPPHTRTGKKKLLTLQLSLVRGFHILLPLKINTFFQPLGCEEPCRGSGFPAGAQLVPRTASMTKHKHQSYPAAVRLEKSMKQSDRSEREATTNISKCVSQKSQTYVNLSIDHSKLYRFCQLCI